MPGPIILGGNLIVSPGIVFEISGSVGAPGQVLSSSGSGLYWGNSSGGGGGGLLAGNGLTSNSTHYLVLANTGIIANTTGTFLDTTYTSTLTVNAAGFIGNSSGTIANIASWVTGNAATAYSNAITIASNATNLTSGTVNPARLGSGTANSTTILYGNNVWAAAPAGGGVNTAASFAWTNTHTFSANVSLSNTHLSQTVLKGYKEFVSNVTVATTSQTLDLSTTNIFNLTLNNNPIALTFSNPPPAGTMYTFTLVLTQDTIGSRTVTYPANGTTVCKFTDNLTPILSTGASKTDFVQFLTYDGGNTYFGALSIANT